MQEGGDAISKLTEFQPEAVSQRIQRAGELLRHWGWVELSIWTERMLTALDTGVKGGKWLSLIDKVTPERTLKIAFQKVADNQGAAGVDHVTIPMFEAHQDDERDAVGPQRSADGFIECRGLEPMRCLGDRHQVHARAYELVWRFRVGDLEADVRGSCCIPDLLGTAVGGDHPLEMARQHAGRLTGSRPTVPRELARGHELQQKVIQRRWVFGAKLGVAACLTCEAIRDQVANHTAPDTTFSVRLIGVVCRNGATAGEIRIVPASETPLRRTSH